MQSIGSPVASDGRFELRRLVDRSPLAFVAGIAIASALVRFGVALTVRTPIIYPDEYLYAALSRALGHGHFATIRGGHISLRSGTSAYLAPVLMAPFWLLAGVGAAYRLCQALGAVAFATAVFPAYGIARRLGISGGASVVVAFLTVAIPSGVFTSMLLSEAYAYPVFLLAVFVAIEAITAPSPLRVVATLVLGVALCLAGGLQFLYFVPACIAAYLVTGASSWRAYLVRGAIVAVGVAYLVHAVEARSLVNLNYSARTLVSWFVVNLFAFAIGAGWVVVPGGFAGLWGLMRGSDRRGRAFAFLAVFLIGAMLLEATVWSASGQGVYERFAFYGAPLVIIALIRAIEARTLVRGEVAAVAYVAAIGAALLPVLRPLHGAYDEHSPSLHALSDLNIGDRPASIVWAPVLVTLALLVAWRGATAGWNLVAGAIALCVALSVGASFAYIRHQPDTDIPHARAPDGSSLVTWQDADPYSVMKDLFWNPSITKVVVLGPPLSPDGFPFTAAQLNPNGTMTSSTGAVARGPFVLAPDTTPLEAGGAASRPPFTVLHAMPAGVAFGWPKDGNLAVVGRIFVRGGRHSSLALSVRSPNRTHKTISLRCNAGVRKDLVVGPAVLLGASLPVPANEVRACWFGLTRGSPERVGRFNFSVKGAISLRRGAS